MDFSQLLHPVNCKRQALQALRERGLPSGIRSVNLEELRYFPVLVKAWLMPTALPEPPRGIRVGRLVKVIAKTPKPKPSPPRAEPPAPKSEEVRLVFFLGVGGAACLAVLALAGLMLVPRGNGAAEDASTTIVMVAAT